ncbi:MAG: ABC transporter C-terminal domain-containing protein, partial [Eubacteriaceae bacterium]
LEKQKRRNQATQRNRQYRLLRDIEKELKPLEEKINQLNREKDDIEEKLCQREILQDSQKVQVLMTDLNRINNDLEYLIIKWEEVIKEKERITEIR